MNESIPRSAQPDVRTTALPIASVGLSQIEMEEHEEMLAGLHDVQETDLGVVTVRVGLNAAGEAVTLLNTMGGHYAVVSKTR